MTRNIRTLIAVAATVLTLGAASYAVAAKACCVELETNGGCCATTATSDCCK